MSHIKGILALTSVSLLVLATAGMAATNGDLGSSSTGTTDISITIPSLVKISDLQDINLGTVSTVNGDIKGSTTACIYSNQPAAGGSGGGYQVTANGNGAGNAFTVSDGANTLAYTAYWKPDTSAGDGTQVTSGSSLANQDGADTSSISCAGTGLNAKFTVAFSQSNIAAAPPGTYTGTATIVIAPT